MARGPEKKLQCFVLLVLRGGTDGLRKAGKAVSAAIGMVLYLQDLVSFGEEVPSLGFKINPWISPKSRLWTKGEGAPCQGEGSPATVYMYIYVEISGFAREVGAQVQGIVLLQLHCQAMRGREQNAAPNKYTDIQAEYAEHSSLPCTLDGMRTVGLIQSDSMDLQNDPRFFQSNVLNKRLAAFSKVELGVISSLMLGACTHVIEMKKDLNFQTTEGILRALSFGLLSIVMFLSIITTYVGVAQMYHTCRLETAGPTGFEIATSYYLNPNIVAWRHFAVRCMIHGLTIFLISTGIRVSVTFEDVAEEAGPRISKTSAHILGLVTLMLFCIAGLIMHYINVKHQAIFRCNYEHAKESERPYMSTIKDMMFSKRNGPQPYRDVV